MYSNYPNVHVSEWAWIGTQFDYEINNDGSKVQLEAMSKHMLDIFRGPVNMRLSA